MYKYINIVLLNAMMALCSFISIGNNQLSTGRTVENKQHLCYSMHSFLVLSRNIFKTEKKYETSHIYNVDKNTRKTQNLCFGVGTLTIIHLKYYLKLECKYVCFNFEN